jgi:SET domain-containing protein
MSEYRNHIEVKTSPREGLGIFALRDFDQGELIHRVAFEREITEQFPLRPELGERFDHCSYPDGKIMLVAFPYRHMNHSCDPNAYYSYGASGQAAVARRRISKGEEVSVDYLINNPGGDSWPCRCGSSRCRGFTGNSFFELPQEIRQEYAGLLASWFTEKFAQRLREIGVL